MSDLDNQDQHKDQIQNRVRNTRAGVPKDGSPPSDLDDQQDNKGHTAPNLTFPRVLKKGDTQDDD